MISIYRTPDACIPVPLLIDVQRFDGDNSNDNNLPQQQPVQSSINSQQANVSKKVLVMKRNTSKHGEMSNKDTSGKQNQLSALEKEKAYAAARARIFGGAAAGGGGESNNNEEWALAYDEIKTSESSEIPNNESTKNNNNNNNNNNNTNQNTIAKNKSKSDINESDQNMNIPINAAVQSVFKLNKNDIASPTTSATSATTTTAISKKLAAEYNQQNPNKSSPLKQNKSMSPPVPEKSYPTSKQNSAENLNLNIESSSSKSNSGGGGGGRSGNNRKAVVDPSSWKDSSKFTLRDKDAERSDPDFTRRNVSNNVSTTPTTPANNNYSQQQQPPTQHIAPHLNVMNTNGNNTTPPPLNNYPPYHEHPNNMIPVYANTPYASYPPNMYPPVAQQIQIPANNMQPQWINPNGHIQGAPMNPAYYHGNLNAAPVPMHMYANPPPPDYYPNGSNYMPNQYQQPPPQQQPNRGYQQQQPNLNNYGNNNSNNNNNQQQARVYNNHEFPPLGNS